VAKAPKKLPDEVTSFTGDEKLDAIAGALVLLLSDLGPADQVKVLRAATAQGVIVTTVNMDLREQINLMREEVKILAGYFDGSSGLGRMAASNAQQHVNALMSHVTRVRSYVG
jgi:hypothetical protein